MHDTTKFILYLIMCVFSSFLFVHARLTLSGFPIFAAFVRQRRFRSATARLLRTVVYDCRMILGCKGCICEHKETQTQSRQSSSLPSCKSNALTRGRRSGGRRPGFGQWAQWACAWCSPSFKFFQHFLSFHENCLRVKDSFWWSRCPHLDDQAISRIYIYIEYIILVKTSFSLLSAGGSCLASLNTHVSPYRFDSYFYSAYWTVLE